MFRAPDAAGHRWSGATEHVADRAFPPLNQEASHEWFGNAKLLCDQVDRPPVTERQTNGMLLIAI
jgi:hypothetical protein